ncbi:MAG TPA: PPC domain-containing protein [Nannocystaceae bacterium]|nr:PPC domain-containing protein [Nannocystaceae bacterium]
MTRPIALFCSLLALVPACDSADGDLLELGEGDLTKGGAFGKADSSVQAVIVDIEFDGSVLATSSFSAQSTIDTQLLYTIGQLNGDNSVGRLDQADVEITSTQSAGNGLTRVNYHVRMPVAWGKKNAVPATYELRLPADATFDGQEAFTEKYSHSCVDFGAHDVDSGSMWYYYRPRRSGCTLAEGDIVRTTATVAVSSVNTTGKYPEYDKVWEDDVLQVVAVFGKYEDFATSSSDAGISAFNRFHSAIKQELGQFGVVTEPANVGSSPGVATPDITYTAELPDGKSIEVHALLVDNVRTAGAAFDARYAELSSRADFIAYSGHAGLGANIRALARKGEWVSGQYVIVFQNGCDTYAYVDSALWDAHSAINADDPTGTKYVDILNNAMPSFFSEMPNGSMAIIRGLLSYDDPQTYEQIMTHIDSDEVVLVTGEQDNVFVPGGGGDDGDDDVVTSWTGMEESGTVAKNQEVRFATPKLAAGRYVFELTGTADADLYVRTGTAPTEESFECRPFKSGSNESCAVELTTPATIHVMVRGWASSSSWELRGTEE